MQSLEPLWPIGKRPTGLPEHAVHLWSIDLMAEDEKVAQVEHLLSKDEIARADRFKFARHRRRFVIARSTLRQILASYCDVDPSELTFLTTKYGKPFLSGAGWQSTLDFNLSHSHEFALLGVTIGRRIGVDLENRRQIVDIESIARHFFSSAEIDVLLNTPEHDQHHVFLNCWTRKEAYIKGIGQGLSHPLDTFVVSMSLDEPAKLIQDKGEPEAHERWAFQALFPHQSYVAALAIERNNSDIATDTPLAINCWHWPYETLTGKS